MYRSSSALKEEARKRLAQSLNGRLADGLSLANHNDSIAERAVTLGAHAYGTVRHAAKASSLPEYEAETRRDLDHVRLLADLLTGIIEEFEKHGWFLRASLES